MLAKILRYLSKTRVVIGAQINGWTVMSVVGDTVWLRRGDEDLYVPSGKLNKVKNAV